MIRSRKVHYMSISSRIIRYISSIRWFVFLFLFLRRGSWVNRFLRSTQTFIFFRSDCLDIRFSRTKTFYIRFFRFNFFWFLRFWRSKFSNIWPYLMFSTGSFLWFILLSFMRSFFTIVRIHMFIFPNYIRISNFFTIFLLNFFIRKILHTPLFISRNSIIAIKIDYRIIAMSFNNFLKFPVKISIVDIFIKMIVWISLSFSM